MKPLYLQETDLIKTTTGGGLYLIWRLYQQLHGVADDAETDNQKLIRRNCKSQIHQDSSTDKTLERLW